MKKRMLLTILIPAIAGGVAIALFILYEERRIPSYQEIPDPVVIARTQDLPEVKAFVAKYEDPYVYVDRGSHFSVGYQKTKCELTGKRCSDDPAFVEPYVALMIRLDIKGFPESTAFWCTPDSANQIKIEQNIVEHIEEGRCVL